ncbi:MAG: type II toxin-antitoxin system RelE/ParE family toxin [Acidobacteria bacterium]|nr:type II toxin-antitoxin system RelE/ParE family toxin [Acidobacteriota bacterium]
MIRSFRCKWTRAIFEGETPLRFASIAAAAERRLELLDATSSLKDLTLLPGNRLEALRGDRRGQFSIRVNDQFRICFRWKSGAAVDVEIVDYH